MLYLSNKANKTRICSIFYREFVLVAPEELPGSLTRVLTCTRGTFLEQTAFAATFVLVTAQTWSDMPNK